MRTLLLDIELAPAVVHAWALFDQNIGISQIIAPGHLLCWSAKWYGEKEMQHGSKHTEPKRMLRRIHKLLDDADAVVHYNGTRFDIPHLNREFVLAGLLPPSPYQQIDLLRTVRQRFKFASNKLDFVCAQLGLGRKLKHAGHELWIRCMLDDPDAWAEMEKYNRHDVVLLNLLYDRLRPWVKNHPNHGIIDDHGVPACPNCGSHHLIRRGTAKTSANRYARYQCGSCGAWSRDPTTLTTRDDRRLLMRHIAG